MANTSKYDLRIDLIRFLAFILVFFTHFVNQGGNAISVNENQWWNKDLIQTLARFGGQGVPIFFALTGFLLGRLLIQELEVTGVISIRSFLLRRIYRIWPLYFFFFLLCLAANPFASKTPAINSSEIPFYLTFTYNWGQILPPGIPGSMATITWSVSVEEQIYLILPFLLFITKRPNFKFVTITFFFIGIATHLLAEFNFLPTVGRQTTAYLLPVGFGLLIAIHEQSFREKLLLNRVFSIVAALFSALYPLSFSFIKEKPFGDLVTMLLTSCFFITTLHIADRYIRVEAIPVRILARVGRISYGCYLFHWAIWTVMVSQDILFSSTGGFTVFGVLAGLLLTILISEFSYRYFESWFLRYRRRYQMVSSPVT